MLASVTIQSRYRHSQHTAHTQIDCASTLPTQPHGQVLRHKKSPPVYKRQGTRQAGAVAARWSSNTFKSLQTHTNGPPRPIPRKQVLSCRGVLLGQAHENAPAWHCCRASQFEVRWRQQSNPTQHHGNIDDVTKAQTSTSDEALPVGKVEDSLVRQSRELDDTVVGAFPKIFRAFWYECIRRQGEIGRVLHIALSETSRPESHLTLSAGRNDPSQVPRAVRRNTQAASIFFSTPSANTNMASCPLDWSTSLWGMRP